MILKVLSDAGERDVDANVMPSQFVRRPDAGQHQQLRRVDRARGKNDFAARSRREARAVADILHADGAAAFHDNARDLRVHL